MVGGTDPTSGAGIHLDNHVLQSLGLHGFPVVSAITAQNSQGVSLCAAVPQAQFDQQLSCIESEFVPRIIKLGLICDDGQLQSLIALSGRFDCPLIWDPVMASSSGGVMANAETIYKGIVSAGKKIMLLTPNIPEAEALCGMKIHCCDDMMLASSRILESGISNLLIKGGHLDDADFDDDTFDNSENECCDYFSNGNQSFWIVSQKLKQGASIRGTGCALASAIAGAMALGHDLRDAVVLSRSVVSRNIEHHYQIGAMRFQSCRSWPVHHRQLPKLRYGNPRKTQMTFARCDTDRLGIYPVVDSANWVRALLESGVRTIQLRIKEADQQRIEKEIINAVESANRVGARLFVNDHWQLAIRHNAYGIHLGQEDIKSADPVEIARSGLRLGVSTHSHWEMAAAINLNPSYIALGPIYETTSKEMSFAPQGLEMVSYWVRFLGGQWPLVAIGGIDFERACALKSTGVGSVAMISAITQAECYEQAVAELLDLWEN